jgi:hypothetical protein
MTDDGIERPIEAMYQARHSNAMEGRRELPEDAVVLEAYVRGGIDAAQFERRTKNQHSAGYQDPL